MNKAITAAIALSACLLTGCSTNTGAEVMTIGKVTVKQGTIDNLNTYTYTTSAVSQAILQELYHKEYKDEWEEELNERVDKAYADLTKDEAAKQAAEEQVQGMGYKDLEDYKEKSLKDNSKQFVVLKHYIEDNIDAVYDKFKLSQVKLITTPNEADAKAMIADIKAGKTTVDAAAVFGLEPQEVTLSLKDTTYPAELVEEVIANDTDSSKVPLPGSDGNYYVYKILHKGKDAEGMLDNLMTAFVSDQDSIKQYTTGLLKKYNVQIHDETLYNLLKISGSMLVETEEEETDAEVEMQ